jgi:hypothetical protein
MAETSRERTFLYCYQDGAARIVCPLSERIWQDTTDIVTPYGFSGFAGSGDCKGFAQAFRSFASAQGYVCGYIGLNPLFANRNHFEPNEAQRYNTLYVLDLSLPLSDLFAKLSTNRKRQLKDWDQVQADLFEDRARTAEFFTENFSGFLSEKRAAGVYSFRAETLSQLVAQDKVFLVGAQRDGEVSAVSMFAHTPYAGDYLFNICRPEGRDFAAALIWYGARRLKRMGVPWLNLGGGIREDDGVARFKARFGGEEMGLACLKQVYQPETYRRLCEQAGVDPGDRSGYFPAYRRAADENIPQEQGAK